MDHRQTTQDVIYHTTTPNADTIRLTAPRARIPGGFWRRAMAAILDGCIYSVLTMPLTFVLGALVGTSGALSGADPQGQATLGLVVSIGSNLVSMVVAFFYYGWFYKNKGATPGKMLLRLRVSHADTGTNLTYWRAFGRETLGKILGAILLGIGFLMVALRSDKRGLHDLLFRTQVTYEPK
jgi:uncharacterized RDD family membrane protein YckC